jgi:RNA polymerase sigma-70 factor, ECF subfamily
MLQVAAGDMSAFRELVARHQAPLVNFVYRVVLDRAEAEDLVQETFFNAYKAAARYRPEARFSTWLYRIATNLALNALTARRRRPRVSLDAEENSTPQASRIRADDKDAPDRQLERRELAEAVERALAQLPERQRTAVALHRFEGFSYEEIAEAMSCSVDAVDSLLRRAKTALKQALAPFVSGNMGGAGRQSGP